MTPQIYNKTIYQGNSDTIALRYTEGGIAVDLSAHTARMQIRDTEESITVIREWKSADGEIDMDSDGNLTVSILSADTETLPAGSYVYDIDITLAGETQTLVYGQITCIHQVTRDDQS